MIFLGQDKGHGPKSPKPLSAHLFLRPTQYSWWAKVFAQVAIAPRKSAGPKRKNGQKRLFWGFCL